MKDKKLITLKLIIDNDDSDMNYVEDLVDKYGNYILYCECGHKDLLFKFFEDYDDSYSTFERNKYDGYIKVGSKKMKCHFYCPKCQSSIISCDDDLVDKLMVEKL